MTICLPPTRTPHEHALWHVGLLAVLVSWLAVAAIVLGLWLVLLQPHIEADWTAFGPWRDTWRQAQVEGGR